MFKRIDHIELLTGAPERTIAFYIEVLEFRERERTRIPGTPLGPLDLVYLELGGTTVEVMCYPDAKAIAARGPGYQYSHFTRGGADNCTIAERAD